MKTDAWGRMTFGEKISYGLSSALYVVCMAIASVAGAIMVTGKMLLLACVVGASGNVMADGASPAAQTTANMPQAGLTIHYNRVFMKFLYARLNKLLMVTHMDMPEKSGLTFRNFMNIPLGPDLVQQTQGTLGPPEQISTNYKDIALFQLANYSNISDLAFMTSISDDLVNNRRVMAYQLGLSLDDIVMAQFDYLRTWDARTSNQDSLVSPYPFTKNIIEQMPASLDGATVPPMADGY